VNVERNGTIEAAASCYGQAPLGAVEDVKATSRPDIGYLPRFG
jgi:hypothetical protein